MTERPQNVTAMTGVTVTFVCGTSDLEAPNWSFKPVGAVDYDRIVVSGTLAHSFSGKVDVKENGVSKLIVFNVTSPNSGEYMCKDEFGFGPDSASAQLIIVGTCYVELPVLFTSII